jgi:hypothetical protein
VLVGKVCLTIKIYSITLSIAYNMVAVTGVLMYKRVKMIDLKIDQYRLSAINGGDLKIYCIYLV